MRIRIPGSIPLTNGSGPDPTPDPPPFFIDFKDAKKKIFSYFFYLPQAHHLQSKHYFCCGSGSPDPYLWPVLRIHDILGWIRIRIRGSMPLTRGSGSGFFLLFLHYDRRIRIRIQSRIQIQTSDWWIRIREAKKHVDPDPQHCLWPMDPDRIQLLIHLLFSLILRMQKKFIFSYFFFTCHKHIIFSLNITSVRSTHLWEKGRIRIRTSD